MLSTEVYENEEQWTRVFNNNNNNKIKYFNKLKYVNEETEVKLEIS